MANLIQDTIRFYRLLGCLAWFLGPAIIRRFVGLNDLRFFGRRLRLFLESMGLTYLKLGQYLALRIDITPPEVREELEQLFEEVPPVAFEIVRELIRKEFGKEVEELYSEFEPECVASASVAQVHRATSQDGEPLAVKVQRPGVEAQFHSDVRNMILMGRLVDRLPLLGKLSLEEAVKEFRDYTRRELNFLTEGATADRVRSQSLPFEKVPRIYWELTSRRILSMEFLQGISLARVYSMISKGEEERLHELLPNLDMPLAARRLSHSTLRQLFEIGFFHADPHPGNILLQDDNKIGLVDFGIFGQLSEWERHILSNYIEQLGMGNIDESYRFYSQLSIPTGETDVAAYEHEMKEILTDWYEAVTASDTAPEDRHLGRYSSAVIGAMSRHRVKTSMGMLLFWRTMIVLDSSALRLSAHYDMMESLNSFFRDLRPSPARRLIDALRDPEKARQRQELNTEVFRSLPPILENLSRGRALLAAEVKAQPARRRRETVHCRLLSLAAVTFSLSILAGNSSWQGPALTPVLFGAGLAAITLTAIRMFRSSSI